MLEELFKLPSSEIKKCRATQLNKSKVLLWLRTAAWLAAGSTACNLILATFSHLYFSRFGLGFFDAITLSLGSAMAVGMILCHRSNAVKIWLMALAISSYLPTLYLSLIFVAGFQDFLGAFIGNASEISSTSVVLTNLAFIKSRMSIMLLLAIFVAIGGFLTLQYRKYYKLKLIEGLV